MSRKLWKESSDALWRKLLIGPRIRRDGNCFTREPLQLPFVIAGTNVLWENENEVHEFASRVAGICANLGVPLVFKASYDKANRTCFDSYRGVGLDKGLQMLQSIKRDIGVPILTDVHEVQDVEKVAEVADVLQIPSFLCRQTDLIVAAARTGRIINIKRGQFASPAVMGKAIEKSHRLGNNRNVMVCERGMAFGMENLVFDPRQVIHLRDSCGPHTPVLVDVTHCCQIPPHTQKKNSENLSSGGNRKMVPVVARAAAAAGIDGIFIESHPNPDKAPVDGHIQLSLEGLASTLEHFMIISRVVNHTTEKYRPYDLD